MSLPGFPEPKMISTDGAKLAVYMQGEGLPVVFSHGFPELAYSWRHAFRAVSEAGYRAIAPDQRGYGLSSRPERVEDYDIRALCGDLVRILDAEGHERAVFCGHDWGGIVVWNLALLHPDRVAGVIGVNTPFLPRAPMAPIGLLRTMLGENHYIVHFQKPGEADAAFAADPERVFRRLMRKGIRASDIDPTRPMRNMVEIVQDDVEMGVPLLSDDDLMIYVRHFEKSGFTGGINWYRNMDRNWELTADLPEKVDAPCLMVCAEHDFALPPSLADGMESFVPNLERQLIPECGHWTQWEQPEILNRHIVEWLDATFSR